jgi:hypothetical protein
MERIRTQTPVGLTCPCKISAALSFKPSRIGLRLVRTFVRTLLIGTAFAFSVMGQNPALSGAVSLGAGSNFVASVTQP